MDESMPPCDVPLPLWLVRLLPDLSNAALRVALVVLAETTCWEAESAILSRADFTAHSGLAQSSVQSGIEEALQAQILQRAPVGRSYAYRLKAPADQSAFPTTPSRNVTALRQLQRLQLRLAEQIEFEQVVLERGPRHSFKAADGTAVRGADRIAVRPTDQTTTNPDRKAAPLLPAGNQVDRAAVRLPDQPATNLLDVERISVEWVDQFPVTSDAVDWTAVKGTDPNAVEADRQSVRRSAEERSASRPATSPRLDRQSAKHPVTLCVQTVSLPTRASGRVGAPRKNINNLFTLNHTHTVWENGENSACARAREKTPLSVFSYGEVLAYAESLKGIRNPGGLAVVYWRSGEMDAEIANFQLRQAEIAERQAAEAAARDAEMREMAREMLARGEPLAEWEREFIAAFADEFQEEHDVQIQRLDAAQRSVV